MHQETYKLVRNGLFKSKITNFECLISLEN